MAETTHLQPRLPSPRAMLAGCMWLPRIMAKARLLSAGQLTPEFTARFCHPGGVDGQFLGFFELLREAIVSAAQLGNEEIVRWFSELPSTQDNRIAEWNHRAINLGRPGFPMADRLPVALATTYANLAGRNLATVFEVLEADEATN